MGMGSKRGIARAFGTDEYGFPATPRKVGNVRLSRLEHANERGGCTICYPHGPETSNATVKKNTRSWKSRRKTKYKT